MDGVVYLTCPSYNPLTTCLKALDLFHLVLVVVDGLDLVHDLVVQIRWHVVLLVNAIQQVDLSVVLRDRLIEVRDQLGEDASRHRERENTDQLEEDAEDSFCRVDDLDIAVADRRNCLHDEVE